MNLRLFIVFTAMTIIHHDVIAQKKKFKLENELTDKHQLIPFTHYAIAFPDSTYEIVEVLNGALTYESKNNPVVFQIMPNESPVFEFLELYEGKNEFDFNVDKIENSIKQRNKISSGNQVGLYVLFQIDSLSHIDSVSGVTNHTMLLLIGDSVNSFTVMTTLTNDEYLKWGNSVRESLKSLIYLPDSINNSMEDFPFIFEACNKSMQFSKYFFGMMIFTPNSTQDTLLKNKIFLTITPSVMDLEYDTSYTKTFVTSRLEFYQYETVAIERIEFNGYYGYQGYGKSANCGLGFMFSFTKENQVINGWGVAEEYNDSYIQLFSDFIHSTTSNR
jgi:hypothetical protein